MLKLLISLVLGQSFVAAPSLTLREQASSLLYDASVQASLGLTADQKREVEGAERENDERRDALAKGTSSESTLHDSDRRFAAEVVKSLDAAQREALFVRAIRARGVGALADAEVASRVGLKGIALAKVQAEVKAMDGRDAALSDEMANAAMRLPEPRTPEENRAYDAKMAQMSRAAAPRLQARALSRRHEEKALLASLAPAVRAAWSKLTG